MRMAFGTRTMTAAVTLLAAAACACGVTAAPANEIYGSWRVAEIVCSGCGGPVLSLMGKVITFSTHNVENPAGDDCRTAPGFEHVRELESREVLSGAGKGWPPAVRSDVTAHAKILYGFVTCGGINYMRLAAVSPSSAYYFVEDSVVLVLRRVN